MTQPSFGRKWKSLDTDLHRIGRVELALAFVARPLAAPGIAFVFVVLAGLAAAVALGHGTMTVAVIAASVFGAYMAINIGANDVANNMGPAVGANVLSMGWALVIAALCETAGALLAGGDVVATISSDIIDTEAIADPPVLVWAMMAALTSAALWVNLATWFGAPVSTTHSVVGGVMGAGIAAAGFAAVNWPVMGTIAASWVVSPVMAGAIAAATLAFVKSRIVYRSDRIAAARVWVPVLIAVMAGCFASYLALKGLGPAARLDPGAALIAGVLPGLAVWGVMRPVIHRQSAAMDNTAGALKSLFALPLVVSAAMLSFAHGANDVANAIGPLAAIVHVAEQNAFAARVAVPLWVMAIGAFGISLGLFLFGPRLVRMVGRQITKLNPIRAYCVALSAAITVILASWLGLPVSSTHIAVGGVFGVGFFREWHMERRLRRQTGARPRPHRMARSEQRRRMLVRRSHFMTITAAWIVTVPAAALMSALIFRVLAALAG